MKADPRQRFSGASEQYARSRPSYPGALVDWVLAEAGVRPGDRVADVGCGTGIMTRLLAERGADVLGIDPNEDMLAEAQKAGGRATYRHGEAEATGLERGSVSLVTVAQAFHWLDLEGLRGRAWSSSYVSRGVVDGEGFDRPLQALFDVHARDGVLEFPYRTVALVFRVSSPASSASAIRS
jgi:SAM-dependent methyltransferase